MAGPPLASFGSLGNVKRAGKTLRRARATPGQASSLEEVRKARGVVEAYRSAHAAPLNAAYMGLRSCLRTEGFDLDVSRRLKRLPTIEDKLRRLPWLDLSSMQDIGGCRAVLDTQEQVQRIVKRFCANSLRRNQKSDTVKDYVVSPKGSGYRAVHIYTRYHNRRLEMQLRTRDQDSWAKLVEHLTNTTGIDFKNGEGPAEVHELLRELATSLSKREPDQPYAEDLINILTRLATIAVGGLAIRSDHH